MATTTSIACALLILAGLAAKPPQTADAEANELIIQITEARQTAARALADAETARQESTSAAAELTRASFDAHVKEFTKSVEDALSVLQRLQRRSNDHKQAAPTPSDLEAVQKALSDVPMLAESFNGDYASLGEAYGALESSVNGATTDADDANVAATSAEEAASKLTACEKRLPRPTDPAGKKAAEKTAARVTRALTDARSARADAKKTAAALSALRALFKSAVAARDRAEKKADTAVQKEAAKAKAAELSLAALRKSLTTAAAADVNKSSKESRATKAAPTPIDPKAWRELYPTPNRTAAGVRTLADTEANALLRRFFPRFLGPKAQCPEAWGPGMHTNEEALKAGLFSPQVNLAIEGAITRSGAKEQLLQVRLGECTGSHAEGYGTARWIVVDGNRTLLNEEGFGLTAVGLVEDVDGDGVLDFTQITSDMHQGMEDTSVVLSTIAGGKLHDLHELGGDTDPCAADEAMVGHDAERVRSKVLVRNSPKLEFKVLASKSRCF